MFMRITSTYRFPRFVLLPALLAISNMCAAQQPTDAPAADESKPKERRAVVVTMDSGIDDQWALAHLLLSPEVDVRAVISTHAKSVGLSSDSAATNAAAVIRQVSFGQDLAIAVVRGSSVPLQDEKTPQNGDAVELLISVSRDFSESRRLTLFALGAATDIGSAVLKDPSISNRIAVVAMGFNDWPKGGDVFNVKNDPAAWQILLKSSIPLVVGSTAVTSAGLKLTRHEAAALMRPHGETGEFLYGLYEDWLDSRRELVAQVVGPDTWVIWDEVAVAYLLGLAHGESVPRPRLEADLTFSHPETSERITWLKQIDTQKVWDDFTRKIDQRAANK